MDQHNCRRKQAFLPISLLQGLREENTYLLHCTIINTFVQIILIRIMQIEVSQKKKLRCLLNTLQFRSGLVDC